jgi:hypothetical protein
MNNLLHFDEIIMMFTLDSAITVMKEVVQVTRINQRKEVVLDRVPVSWLTRNVIVTMDGRVMDVNFLIALGIQTVT